MFRKIGTFKTKHQILFSVIISFAVISFWRGIWNLMDIYLLPANEAMSAWVSLVVGLAVLGSTNYIVKELM